MTGAPASQTGCSSLRDQAPSGLDHTASPPRALTLHPKLQRALARFEKARAAWHEAINETQRLCRHEIWACEHGHYGMLFDHPSIQICTSCRAEIQTGTYAGWADYEWRRPKFVSFVVSPREAGAANIIRLRLRDDPRGFQTVSEIASALSDGGDA